MMNSIYRITASLNVILHLHGRITAFMRARNRRHRKIDGAAGIVRDAIESALGMNVSTIYFSREKRSCLEVIRMLKGYGIHIGNPAVNDESTASVQVSKQQAEFAQYLIQRYLSGAKMPRRWADNK